MGVHFRPAYLSSSMSPVSEVPGAPIGGSALFFGAYVGVFLAISLAVYAVSVHHHPVQLFGALVVLSAFTEEFVFEAGFTWSLDIVYLVVVFPVAVLAARELELPKTVVEMTLLLITVFVVALIGASARGEVPGAGYVRILRETVRWTLLLLLPLVVYGRLENRTQWRRLVRLQITTASFVSLSSIVWLAATYAGIFSDRIAAILIEPGGLTLRVTGAMTEPSQFATYLTLSLFLAVGTALDRPDSGIRRWIPTGIITLALFFTYSTSAYVIIIGAAGIGVGTLYHVSSRERSGAVVLSFGHVGRVSVVSVVILVGGFLVTSLFLAPDAAGAIRLFYVTTVGNLLTITDSARYRALLIGVRMWLNYPIIGLGIGSHPYYVEQYASMVGRRGPSTDLVAVLASTGSIGFGAFVAYLLSVYRGIHATLSSAVRRIRYVQISVLFVFLGLIIGYSINPNFRTVFNGVFLALVVSSFKY